MRSLLQIIFLLGLALAARAQQNENKTQQLNSSKKIQIVEASCGQCQLGLPGKSCDLAVRINGKSYFVDGTGLDDHGDAHAKDGFCETVRKAEVQGEVVDNRFKATYFKLIQPENDLKKSSENPQ